jgi:hypothetical protein
MQPMRATRLATGLSAVVLLIGLGLALAYSAVESLTNPGYSLVDGYWRGALPWMGIIEALVVGGATAAVIAGTVAVAAGGGWARRAVTMGLAAVAGLWWFSAAAGAGMSGAACGDCPARAFDPWAYAYSAPILALQMLILPAATVVLLALRRRSSG